MLRTCRKIDQEIVPVVIIIHILFHINIYAADRVYQAFKAAEIDHHIVIDLNPQKLFRRLLRQLVPAKGIGMVDLIPAMSGNAHPGIARYGQQGNVFTFRIEHHHKQSIAAAGIIVLFPAVHA